MHQSNISSIKNICVFCWGRLGDVFIRIPVIEALNKKYPEAKITVITDPVAARAFNPACTDYRIFSFKRSDGFSFKTILKNINDIHLLRKQHFDLSVDLYGGGSSPLISLLVGAKTRLSFDHKPKLKLANNLFAPYPRNIEHWSHCLGSMLSPLGITLDEIGTDTIYQCDNDSRKSIQHLFTNRDTRYIGINLGAGIVDKAWPVKNIVGLLNVISSKINITPAVFFNPGQETLSEEFLSLYTKPCVSLKNLKFEQEAAALEKCDVFITGDTSLMHLATGVKTPVFALFLETRPEAVRPEKNPFFACMIEDTEKELINGYRQVKNNIPAEKATSDFIDFTANKLNWNYPA
jgi:heptosyltransferase-2